MDLCDAVSQDGARCDLPLGHEARQAARVHRSLEKGFFLKAAGREPHPAPETRPPPPS